MRARRGALTAIAASAAGTLAAIGREQGWIQGVVAVAFAILVCLALPVGRTVSERILLLGASALGWNCILWWLPFHEGRATTVMAALAATAGGFVMWELTAKRPMTLRLLPQVGWPDFLPPIAAGASMLAAAPVYLQADAKDQLAALLPGWDNSAHFSMFASIWENGVTQDFVDAPSGELWSYAHYPQAFHATAASVAALIWPDAEAGAQTLVSLYSHACLILVGLASMVLAAGLTSIPTARSKMSTLVLVTALISAFSLGPGLTLHISGFTAFWLPCTLASISAFIAIQWRSANQIAYAAAMLGLIVAIAHGWVLVLTFALPLLGGAAIKLSYGNLVKRPWRSIILITLASLSVLGVLRAVGLLLGNHIGALATPGGIPPPNLLLSAALPVSASICVAYVRSPLSSHLELRIPLLKINLLQSPLILSALCAGFIAFVQLRAGNFPSYYFYKYLLGFSLFSLALLVAVIGSTAPSNSMATRRTVQPRPIFAAWGVLLALLIGILPSGNPIMKYRELAQASSNLKAVASALLDNPQRTACAPTGFATSPSTMDPMNADQWYNALRGDWTQSANARAAALQPDDGASSGMPRAISRWLKDNTGCLLVSVNLGQTLNLSLRVEERMRLLTW